MNRTLTVTLLFAFAITVVTLTGCPSREEGPVTNITIGDPKVGPDGNMTAEVTVEGNPTQVVPVTAAGEKSTPVNGSVDLIFPGVNGKHPVEYKGSIYGVSLLFPGLSKVLGDREQELINSGFGIKQNGQLFLMDAGTYSMEPGNEHMQIEPGAFTPVIQGDGETDVHAIVREREEIQNASDCDKAQVVELIWFDKTSAKSKTSYGRWDGTRVWPLHDVYMDAVRGSSYDYDFGGVHGFGIRAEVDGHLRLQLVFVGEDRIVGGMRVFTLYNTTEQVTVNEGESVGQALVRVCKAHEKAENAGGHNDKHSG